MKRRLEIARGLMHCPKVLFLDEPTLGLDLQTRQKIWDHILYLNKKEKLTVLLTTHYMEEADKLCSRIAIIDHGEIIADSTPSKLKNELGGDTISIESKKRNILLQALKKMDWVKNPKLINGEVLFTVNEGKKRIPEIVRICDKKNIIIKGIELRSASLDDVFLHLTGRRIREESRESFVKKRIRMNKK